MKKLWNKCLITLLALPLIVSSHIHHTLVDSLSSYELFEASVGFESQPMSEMMEKLTPDSPELWHQYSECVGNLLLANLYLKTDVEKITKAVYDLRFHEEMTRACIGSTYILSLLNSHSYLSSRPHMIVEMFNIADLMNSALHFDKGCLCHATSPQDYLMSLMRFKCLDIAHSPLSELPVFQLPELKLHEVMEKQSDAYHQLGELAPLYCQDSPGTFATKNTSLIQWADLEQVATNQESFEYDNQIFQCAINHNPDATFLSFIQDQFVSYFEIPSFSETLAYEMDQECPHNLKKPTCEALGEGTFFFDNPNYVTFETE